jgi:hypothetical protein
MYSTPEYKSELVFLGLRALTLAVQALGRVGCFATHSCVMNLDGPVG